MAASSALAVGAPLRVAVLCSALCRDTKRIAILTSERRIAPDQRCHLPRCCREFVGIQNRPNRKCPQTVGSAIPAKPMRETCAPQAGRVAVKPLFCYAAALRTLAAIGESFAGLVTSSARHIASTGEPRVKKQCVPERDCIRIARNTVGWIGQHRLRPRPVAQDAPGFVSGKFGRRRWCRGASGGDGSSTSGHHHCCQSDDALS